MFIASLLKWWYSAGYIRCAKGWMTRLESALDYFSIDLLLKTMFSLFRQDGAVGSGGALNIRIRRFFERLVSRLIGACIRSIVLIIGLLVITILAITSLFSLIVWAVIPVFPFIGVIITLSGWVPWHL
jgi:hypothetical protein cdiviTM7_02844